MKKVLIYGVTFAFICVTGFVGVSMASDDMDKGPADITLQTADAKKPAQFPHAAHQERIECDKCHKDANFAAAGAWTKDAGHALCKECHKENGASTKCGTCHPKN